MRYSRREFGKLTLVGLPAAWVAGSLPLSARAKIDSKIKGVQIGAITYSFRTIPSADEIIKAYQTIGLGEMELMSNHAEALAGAPSGRGGGPGGLGGGRPAGAPGGGAPGGAPGAGGGGAPGAGGGGAPGGAQGRGP